MAGVSKSMVASDLTSAAMWGDKDLLESLLAHGANPDFPNDQGVSALHEAAYYGEIECASILLEYKGSGGRRRWSERERREIEKVEGTEEEK